MKIIRLIIFVTLFVSWLSAEANTCNRDEYLKIYFLQFGTETFMPISFKEIKKRNDNLVMKKDDFVRLIVESKPSEKIDFFENIRMRIKTRKGIYFINIDGVVLFRNKILGQIDKKILDSIDLGFGLYELESCEPLNIRMIKLVNQGGNTELKTYLQQIAELADWRNNGFIGYKQ